MPRSRRQRGGQPTTTRPCKNFTSIRPGDSGMANVACGRITVFGKPNFGEYNFSIPIPEADRAWVEYPNERSIRTIPGNNNYTIYGGDGNVSLVFPPGEELKLTIWDKENFSGNQYEFTKTCAGPINKACGVEFSRTWTYAKSMRVERLVFMTPTCKKFASIRPGDSGLSNTACERITVFGKPNFGEYNFSIPIPAAGAASVEYATEKAVRTIPGNNNYTIYGGDGNVSLAFPPGEKLKMTIWDKENFTGNKYEFTKTCAGPINKGCGVTFSRTWTYAKSIRVEREMPTTSAPATTRAPTTAMAAPITTRAPTTTSAPATTRAPTTAMAAPTTTMAATTTAMATTTVQVPAYSPTKVYVKGDVIRGQDGKVYKMNEGVGAAGYPPPRPGVWEVVPNAPIILPSTTTMGLAAIVAYSDTKVYAKGDVVRGPDGKVYKMVDGVGVAGYPPPRPGNWELVPNAPIILPSTTTMGAAALAQVPAYSPTKVYVKGDVVRGPDGKVYKMVDGVGVAGYPPPRPGNWEVVATGGAKQRRRRRTQRSKRRRGSRRH